MSFFSRKRHALPSDIIHMMERFGRVEFDPQGSGEDIGSIWIELQWPLQPFAEADPNGFLIALAEAVLPVGGWAVYGASRTLWEFFSSKEIFHKHPAYNAIMSGAIAFLRANRVPPMKVRGYEWQHWINNGGTSDTWVPRRPIPSPDEAPISELQSDEIRRVTQLEPERDSNAILVRRNGDGRYCALIDAKWSDEDPRRVQNEWKFAESLYELYIQIGLAMQVPTFWYDRELEPYFPLTRPRI